ncbi:hypothetical protein QR680_015148 [Steinernema hermaphroditum]|uniref:SH3 domain-containing protein n=1 Tax=Steinernema hermaphroditum TaxID=289476 RepID=A0AA39IBC4_9BILA|nr:hypothetical protein QR680_015148 [Steinernema hermaphroditum]
MSASSFQRSQSTPLDPTGVGTATAPTGSSSYAASVASNFHQPPSEALLLALRRSRPDTRLFRVLFQYIPLRDSPNENPQLELPLQAGDYILVHGEMDEDRFYHGETLYGQTGLVPSNYVERVSDEQLVANAAAAASRSQSPSFPLQVPAHHAQIVHDFSSHSGPATADTPLPDSVCPYPPVDVTNVKVQEIKEPNQPRSKHI